jgi:dienelactone hydrolase/ribosomal protein L40E
MPSPSIRCRQCGYQFNLDAHDFDEGQALCRQCGATVPIRGGPRRETKKPGGGGSYLYVWVIVGLILAVVLAAGCCGGMIFYVMKTVGPAEYPEQSQDYADARKSFKTKLIRSGPAPQDHAPLVRPADATEIPFKSGNLTLKAWINLPLPEQKLMPAVIFLHGGFAFGEDDWDQCKPFRDAGFVTMTPILRGENGQPGAYTLFYDEVDDVLAARDELAKVAGVDPQRIFVAGHSAGGTLALLTAMASTKFKACASFSGSPDQIGFIRGQEHLAPFDQSDPREFQMRSPLAYPKSFKCPVQLYWGDEELPLSLSNQKLAEKCAKASLDVQAIPVEGDHMSSVDAAMGLAIPFFLQRP